MIDEEIYFDPDVEVERDLYGKFQVLDNIERRDTFDFHLEIFSNEILYTILVLTAIPVSFINEDMTIIRENQEDFLHTVLSICP